MLALVLQRLRGVLDVLGGGCRRIRVGLDAGDVVRDVLGALRRVLRRARDLLRGGTLLLYGGGDRSCDLVDLAYDAADALDRVDGLARHLLDVRYLFGDFFGRFGGLARPRFPLSSSVATA